jgi:hypothetical protein
MVGGMLFLRSSLIIFVTLGFTSTASLADEYDAALRCLLLIEFAKMEYEQGNIDTLRDAGNFYIEETNRTRPPDLTDQQKLERFNGVLEAIREEGGLSNETNKVTAKACTGRIDLELILD